MWTVAAVLALGAGLPRPVWGQCPDGSPPPCGRPRQVLDTTRYVILPFVHREGSQTATLDGADCAELLSEADRKSTRLNSSHRCISYAVFCLKKKKNTIKI